MARIVKGYHITCTLCVSSASGMSYTLQAYSIFCSVARTKLVVAVSRLIYVYFVHFERTEAARPGRLQRTHSCHGRASIISKLMHKAAPLNSFPPSALHYTTHLVNLGHQIAHALLRKTTTRRRQSWIPSMPTGTLCLLLKPVVFIFVRIG